MKKKQNKNTDMKIDSEILQPYIHFSKKNIMEKVNFSVESSENKDYDISLMTGNNSEKGSEKK